MIVVDTSVWVDHFADRVHEPAVALLWAMAEPSRIVVGDVVVPEVLRGARDDRHAERLADVLGQFRAVSMLSPDLARFAARLYRDLRAEGITVAKFPDLIIAAYCLGSGCGLLTRDRDFRPFAEHFGLRLL